MLNNKLRSIAGFVFYSGYYQNMASCQRRGSTGVRTENNTKEIESF